MLTLRPRPPEGQDLFTSHLANDTFELDREQMANVGLARWLESETQKWVTTYGGIYFRRIYYCTNTDYLYMIDTVQEDPFNIRNFPSLKKVLQKRSY